MHTWEIWERQQFNGFAVQSQAETFAQFGEKILYEPLKLSGRSSRKHGGHVLGWDLSGHAYCDQMKFLIGTARGVIKTRTRRRVEEEQRDPEFAKSIKGELRHPVPMINSDHVLAAISDTAGVRLEEDQADARLGQQDEVIDSPGLREVSVFSMPLDRLVTQVRSDTLSRNVRHKRFGKEVRSNTCCPGCPTIGSHHQAGHSDTCRDRMRAELEMSEEGR